MENLKQSKNSHGASIYKILLTIFVGFLSVFCFAEASTNVFFKESNVNINRGDIFSIDLKISSDKAINVIDGTLLFDNKKLFVREVKIDGSLFTIWAKSPTFDNSTGKISFTGGVPGGFSGKDGQVIKITFRAKGEGDTKVDFQDIFSVFLNDGLGTRVNIWMEPITLSINTIIPETFLGKTLQILSDKNIENNNFPLIIFIVLILAIIVFFVRRKNKKGV